MHGIAGGVEGMRLLDEIVDYAVDNKQPVSVLLRKCLVLAYQLKNDRLKKWVEKELDGYNANDEVPEYRRVDAQAKGTLFGPFNAVINDQPLAPLLLREEHRHFALFVKLIGPIAAYDMDIDKNKSGKFKRAWPPDITLLYQGGIIKDYALNRAWQEIPVAAIIALIDTIRNRVLRFALELRDELGLVSDNPEALPQGKVDQYVTNYIYNIGSVSGDFVGKVQDNASVNMRSTVTYTTNDLTKINELVSDMLTHWTELPFTTQQRTEIEAQLKTIQDQLTAQTPNHSRLREALHTVRHILEAGVAHVLVGHWTSILHALG
jgi:hypothetical protein